MSSKPDSNLNAPRQLLGVRIFNAIGGLCRRLGWERKLTVDQALRAAERSTGLSDFGDDSFLTPLSLLVQDFPTANDLHPFGRYCVRQMLEQHLINRLLLQANWKRHPDWLQTPLQRPLYVIGMPRTGTTLLYNLLCQDPHARPLMVWETLYPAPTEREDRRNDSRPRQSRARFLVNAMNILAPNLKQIHAIEPDGPEECSWLMNNTFYSELFVVNGRLPRYWDHFVNAPHETWLVAYQHYRQQLQQLQQGPTQRHWVLKSPVHQASLLPMMEMIPEANVVQTHRDPKKVIPSCCSLVAQTRGIMASRIDLDVLGSEFVKRMHHSTHQARLAEAKYGDRMTDVFFEDLVRHPVETVKRIYARFGYDYSDEMEAGMRRWLEDNPQGKHGSHKYSAEQFGLTDAEIDRTFADYWPRASAA